VAFQTVYGALSKTIDYITETTPAKKAVVHYQYPISDEELIKRFRKVLKDHKGHVKIAFFDTVASGPGVRMPFEKLAEICREEGVLSMIDGAHGVGHVDLDLSKVGADFFTSNCHKYDSPSHEALCPADH
jgi:hercynylcysteine S-oxide lyase